MHMLLNPMTEMGLKKRQEKFWQLQKQEWQET